MTAVATPATTSVADAAPPSATPRLTFARVVRSEAIKITTLRSTWWALAVGAALSVGISALIAGATAQFSPGFPAINAILSPTQFTMLVAGILGAIVVTGEYSTGMIRSTLTAEPRRGAVLLAKALVVTVLVAVATVITYAAAIAVTAPLLATPIAWGEPSQALIPLAFGVLAMVSFALLGLGIGFTVRNGAGAIATTVGILFVLPIVFTMFSFAGEGWQRLVDLGQYLPMNAAATLTGPGETEVVPALLALAAWVIGPALAGWITLRSRDA